MPSLLSSWSEKWNGIFARSLTERSLVDVPSVLVEMIPFDLSIALTENRGVDETSLAQLVNIWLNSNFRTSVANLAAQGDTYNFDQVILSQDNGRRNLRALQSTYLASYTAMSVWKRDLAVPDETTVAAIQLEALLDRAGLESTLQQADDSTGLGSTVVAARATLNTNTNTATQPPSSSEGGSDLDIVIIVAIVIAVLAFCLLTFAVFMAWRTRQGPSLKTSEKKKRRTTNSKRGLSSPGTKDTEASNKKRGSSSIPSEIEGDDGVYPASVISDDINSSLTAYYQSGMSGNKSRYNAGNLNDAASVSSMESYGYSLDGYASSIAPEAKA